ncbi:MAG: tetratricopeptide repeat protein [Pseudomonadota bacterium]|nr:tetratricopeptide repeat protein [Pseudomonadota bacterium]
MFRAVAYQFLRFDRYFFWASVLVVMNACVTTTTGGFNVEASDEETLENHIQLAVAYFNADDMPNARRYLNNALEIDSRNSEANNILALISQREGDLELAIENFQRAVRLDQDNARARNKYIALLFFSGDYENASDELLTVMQDAMYEGRAVAFENVGGSAVSPNRLEEGEVAFTHIPRALLAGIIIESRFNNQKLVDDFTRIPTTLYQDSSEYAELQQRMPDAN